MGPIRPEAKLIAGLRALRLAVESTAVRTCAAGHPTVLRCYPARVVQERIEPFPTLYWLACPHYARELARLEHKGDIDRLQRAIAGDAALREAVHADHVAYREERWQLLRDDDRQRLAAEGRAAPLRETGIGGIRNFDAVKCLHLHYAHHLARGSAIGRFIEAHAELPPCPGP